MKFSSATVLAASAGLATAGSIRHSRRFNFAAGGHPTIQKRQVPQEQSHGIVLQITRNLLNLNNPKEIVDPVFGLLGNAAAAEGAGSVTNLDCLKQETADQAFTNAKEIGDLEGMAGALLFQAIERNTLGVGVESVLCTETPVNPEIGALTQHQDAAAPGAQALNKAITLELARQLAAIGADPLLALLSGTFAPGDVNDNTGAGNSCDTEDPELGCIYTEGLLVLDASQEEIAEAVADVAQTFTGSGGIFATELVDLDSFSTQSVTDVVDLATVIAGGGAAGGETPAATPGTPAATTPAATTPAITTTQAAECIASPPPNCSVVTTTVVTGAESTLVTSVAPTATAGAGAGADAGADAGAGAGAGNGGDATNLQAFTGTLGGPAPPVVSGTGDRPFEVNGNSFPAIANALVRSCDIQNNQCFNAVNSGALDAETSECSAQLDQCKAAASGGALRRRQAAGEFGSCSDPTIVFSDNLADRNEAAFVPANTDDFNHGSAQKIGIIASFICQRLADSCKADASVVADCQSAAAEAGAATQDQTAADVFNQGLVGSGNSGNGNNNNGNNGNNNAAQPPATTAAPPAAAPPAASAVVMTVTVCQ
jgi:hypothetical protein